MKVIIGTFLIPIGILGLIVSVPILAYAALMGIGFGGGLTFEEIIIVFGIPLVFIILIIYGVTLRKTDNETK